MCNQTPVEHKKRFPAKKSPVQAQLGLAEHRAFWPPFNHSEAVLTYIQQSDESLSVLK